MVGNIVRLLEFGRVENGLGEAYPAAADALGLGDEPTAVRAVGGLLSYITETQKTNLSHINSLEFYTDGKYMELDVQTVRNLELISTMRTLDKKGSLLWSLVDTRLV